MADLIDRDAVAYRVKSCITIPDDNEWDSGYNTAMAEAEQYIQHAPAVNRWIPCSERMPENRCVVIFTVDIGHPFVCVGYRINSERDGLKLQRWFDKLSGLNFSDYDVKAWMPTPDAYEPPKEDETLQRGSISIRSRLR